MGDAADQRAVVATGFLNELRRVRYAARVAVPVVDRGDDLVLTAIVVIPVYFFHDLISASVSATLMVLWQGMVRWTAVPSMRRTATAFLPICTDKGCWSTPGSRSMSKLASASCTSAASTSSLSSNCCSDCYLIIHSLMRSPFVLALGLSAGWPALVVDQAAGDGIVRTPHRRKPSAKTAPPHPGRGLHKPLYLDNAGRFLCPLGGGGTRRFGRVGS